MEAVHVTEVVVVELMLQKVLENAFTKVSLFASLANDGFSYELYIASIR